MADNKKQNIIIIKKKKGGHGGHHGGAWKVAYADFVTAMMAFFLVMWLMGSDEEIKAAVAEFFMNPNSTVRRDTDPTNSKYLGGNTGDGESVMRGLNGEMPAELVNVPALPFTKPQEGPDDSDQYLNDVINALAKRKEIDVETLKITIAEDALFVPGTDEFSKDAQQKLNAIGKVVRNFPGKLKVEGYSYPIPNQMASASQKNLYEFSLTRVVSVMAYFVHNRWIDESRVTPVVHTGKRSLAGVKKEQRKTKATKRFITLSLN